METECVIHSRTITPEEVEGVRKLLRDHPDWSRLSLSREVCAAWDWRLPAPSKARQAGNAKGELRDIACRTALLRLHRGGRIDLPEADIKNFHEYRLETCPECGNAEVTFLNQPPRVIQQMEIEEVIVRKEEHRSYPVGCERCQLNTPVTCSR